MVTNINLSSAEFSESEKRTFTGKSALIISLVLLAIVFLAFSIFSFLKARYISQNKEVLDQISQEEGKIRGTMFTDLLSFQEKLNLLDKVMDDHSYWDNLLRKMSGYFISEVRLTKFSGKKDASGAGIIEINGIASNLDTLSRELILLKGFPEINSLEFKNASENIGQADQSGGVMFEITLRVGKSAFQK